MVGSVGAFMHVLRHTQASNINSAVDCMDVRVTVYSMCSDCLNVSYFRVKVKKKTIQNHSIIITEVITK